MKYLLFSLLLPIFAMANHTYELKLDAQYNDIRNEVHEWKKSNPEYMHNDPAFFTIATCELELLHRTCQSHYNFRHWCAYDDHAKIETFYVETKAYFEHLKNVIQRSQDMYCEMN